ncbi:hypothetical protein [Streptomyces sp. NPDC088180]
MSASDRPRAARWSGMKLLRTLVVAVTAAATATTPAVPAQAAASA